MIFDSKFLESLFNLDHSTLFAQSLAQIKSKVPSTNALKAAPVILDNRCFAFPPCRHCKWESLKIDSQRLNQKKNCEDAVKNAVFLEKNHADRIFITTGWQGYKVSKNLIESISKIREAVNIDIYGRFGAVSRESLCDLKSAGLTGFLCSLETPNQGIYRGFRPGGDSLSDRIDALYNAKEIGLDIWSGFLVGLGESDEDCKVGLKILEQLHPRSLSILPFEPFPNTSMAGHPKTDPRHWARIAAIAHLYLSPQYFFSNHSVGEIAEYGNKIGCNAYCVPPNFIDRFSTSLSSN